MEDQLQQSSVSPVIAAAEKYVSDWFAERLSPEYVFHDFQHTVFVVHASLQIAEHYNLTETELEHLQLAAWFHDTGYTEGSLDHEERSATHAEAFLQAQNYDPEGVAEVQAAISATRREEKPANLLEEILRDADLAHLGNEYYWDRCGRIRQEIALLEHHIMSDREWVDFELDFMTNHQYHTQTARDLFNERKERHIQQLFKQRRRLHADQAPGSLDQLQAERRKNKKKKKKKGRKGKGQKKASDLEVKQLNLGRGVETMYRTTYRTHVNLSSIADNKANIMLSINAIIISIVVANLVPRFDSEPQLILPTVFLLVVCLTALVYAILATQPKVTEGKFTRKDIEEKRANLLFFGNFYNMPLPDFHWGMMEMIKDNDFLYSSMTRDLYFLGIVLAKKYRYLNICYRVFMYGLIVAVAIFALSYLPVFNG